jgi:hypothetical protein
MGAFRNNVGKIKFSKLIKRHIRTFLNAGCSCIGRFTAIRYS